MTLAHALAPLLALALGVLHALAFAPWGLPWLQLLALAGLFVLAARAASWRGAALLGLNFGIGWFGLGVSWVYISMHTYGLVPAPIAAAATLAFCAFLGLYPALALGLSHALAPAVGWRLALVLPAAWALSEWLRGTLFTGFPWLASGYAHSDGPLAGFAPVLGVHGIGLVAALVAGALALLAVARGAARAGALAWAVAVLTLALAPGLWLAQRTWSTPYGDPIVVRLVQGSIPQDQKFDPDGLDRAVALYGGLMRGAGLARADLIVLPESVFPVSLPFLSDAAIKALEDVAVAQRAALVFGIFLEEPGDRYFNSAVALQPGRTELLAYSKRHLVPLGEFIPPGFRWFVDLMQMPIGDQQRGADYQPPFALAGQRIGMNICYEDLFGAEIRTAFRDPALAPTLLLNISNLAWFDDSIALPQHLQISRMRALETSRPMLRATNTGVTAVIDERGRVLEQLPILSEGVLQRSVQGTTGETPFVRWGNGPALGLAGLLLVAGVAAARRRRRAPSP